MDSWYNVKRPFIKKSFLFDFIPLVIKHFGVWILTLNLFFKKIFFVFFSKNLAVRLFSEASVVFFYLTKMKQTRIRHILKISFVHFSA